VLDLRKRETETLKYWKAHRTNDEIRKRRAGGKVFYFLDGPPYAYTELASHHLWVYAVKDLIVRYKKYRGFRVHDRPGFDVHGVPTENRVERNLKIASKADIETKIGVANFVSDCRKLAEANIRNGIDTLTDFGVSLDFENVYIPFRNEYISKGWEMFKTIYNKGLVYRSLQPLAYCPHCETVLSAQGPEVEYTDDSDPSIFVALRIAKSSKDRIGFGRNSYLVIWTTTPWTLPANMSIAANPKALYVMVKGDSANYIVAKERLEDFAGATKMSVILEKEFYGSELDGVRYLSPFEDRIPAQKGSRKYHKVILSETFVNVSEGTGLLHVAPGHGIEDAKLGKAHRIPFFSPVDEHSTYTADAGAYSGLKIPDEANERVLADLASLGALLFRGETRHSYPHCWRCSSRLIYRATEQWFINIQRIKRRMIGANRKVIWHPEIGGGWFEDAVESSPDWNV
jgi:isoleucyl-tRNA synthetase